MGHRSVVRGGAHSQCGAKTRAGTACQSPPVPGRRRCRLHGGLSPGAPRGSRNGNYRRGDWTTEAIEERRWLRSLVQAFAPNSGICEIAVNASLAFIEGAKPRDETRLHLFAPIPLALRVGGE
jgi:hypothetical protein